MPQALPLGAQLVLLARAEALGVGRERAELLEARLGGRRVPRELVVRTPCRRELPPGAARGARSVGRPGVGVQRRELVRGPCEPALLELAAHGEQRLDRRRDVLARGAPAPGVGARAPVGEDPPREDERLLALRAELGELAEGLVVREVELGLDVRLVGGRSDHRRLPTGAEQEPDRVREDRLPGARLARDRVQPGIELELGLPDQDEVLDAQPPEHPGIVRRRGDRGDRRRQGDHPYEGLSRSTPEGGSAAGKSGR